MGFADPDAARRDLPGRAEFLVGLGPAPLTEPMPAVELVLASASPSRARLLSAAGIAFRQLSSDVDEDALAATLAGASSADLALALARAKCEAVVDTLLATPGPDHAPERTMLVLGCDSVLEFDGKAWGKPGSAAAATQRWRRQRGGHGTLLTGHWLIELNSQRATGRTVGTEVSFVDATDQEIADYVASGEPLGVAGAFTLEGRAGPLIAGIQGDPSNVVGLSLPALRTMVRDLGHELRDVATHAAVGRATP
jgi:septum formation protein